MSLVALACLLVLRALRSPPAGSGGGNSRTR